MRLAPGLGLATLDRVSEYIHHHKEIFVWLGALSAATFVGSLILIPILCVRMGEDYFMPHRDKDETLAGRHPLIRWTGLILKNLIGLLLVVRLQEVALFFLFLGYITYGLFAHYQRGVRHAQMRALRRKVVKMKQEASE